MDSTRCWAYWVLALHSKHLVSLYCHLLEGPLWFFAQLLLSLFLGTTWWKPSRGEKVLSPFLQFTVSRLQRPEKATSSGRQNATSRRTLCSAFHSEPLQKLGWNFIFVKNTCKHLWGSMRESVMFTVGPRDSQLCVEQVWAAVKQADWLIQLLPRGGLKWQTF